jgi:putative endonuclease
MLSRMWFVYIVRCADRSLYTGITTDANRRVEQHNCGRGARYTRARCPVRLVYLESAGDRGAALRREHEIKRMSPGEKRRLVRLARSGGDVQGSRCGKRSEAQRDGRSQVLRARS